MKFESVMKLREKLDHLGLMKGITQDKKGLAIIAKELSLTNSPAGRGNV